MAHKPRQPHQLVAPSSAQDRGEIVVFSNPDGTASIDVRLENETVWLTVAGIAHLFEVDRSVVSRHAKNIIRTDELGGEAFVQKMHKTGGRPAILYSLDMILSIGYRVNSSRAANFRRWANTVLKDHLIEGYSLNERRWSAEQIEQFQRAIALFPETIQHLADRGELSSDESVALMRLVTGYASSWVLLRQYDDGELAATPGVGQPTYVLTSTEAHAAIDQLRHTLTEQGEASTLFGNKRGEAFESILGALYQTFGGEELYPTIEQKAAHLLYFVIKDHPFSDGNKRIGSFLFLHFLDRNHYLATRKNEPKINPAALVALALLVAESDPRQKDVVVQLIIHFLAN